MKEVKGKRGKREEIMGYESMREVKGKRAKGEEIINYEVCERKRSENGRGKRSREKQKKKSCLYECTLYSWYVDTQSL
jgi:hypothetical protein